MWSLYIPTTISRVTIDFSKLPTNSSISIPFSFDATTCGESERSLSGDVDLYKHDSEHPFLRMEGITCVPFSPPRSKDDNKLFFHETWNPVNPDVVLASYDRYATQEDHDFAEAMERVSYFYANQLDSEIPADHPERSNGPYKGLFGFVNDISSNAPDARHLYIKTEWRSDTNRDIAPTIER